MGIPTESELKQALEAAANLRESGKDEDYIAKCLLNLHYRFSKAERIVTLTKIYLHGGQGAVEHAKLVKAIEEFEKVQPHDEDQAFGLE